MFYVKYGGESDFTLLVISHNKDNDKLNFREKNIIMRYVDLSEVNKDKKWELELKNKTEMGMLFLNKVSKIIQSVI